MRLPNGYGSVYKLSGNRRKPWVARRTADWHDNGQPIYEYIGYYTNRKEALIALSDYNKNPYDIKANTITFQEVYEKWSKQHFQKISHSNEMGIRASYKICTPLYNLKFIDIKLTHLQHVIDTSNKNTPTLKKLKIMLGLMYDYAVAHEIVTQEKREMVRYVDISNSSNPNKIDRKPFTKKEIERLWNVLDSNEYYSVVLILIYTGLRISELLELKKEDVHLEERWFYVRESKTQSGIREVPIAEKIVPLIEKWMNKPCDHLICTLDNQQFKYRNYYDSYFKPLLETLGMTQHRPHDTRHTCISLLTTALVDERVIKQIVGHKGIGITESVYTHLELPIKLEAINKI